ncbi:MAG: UvrB/UvrC motif-containing protein, partial [Bacillota bacterium]|nr:UvrB/UvrC motif-containing protein [Bacillota bacterium]
PLFNKKMKSPHSYVYIVIHTDEELHRIEITKNPIKNDGKQYFGPFVSRQTVQKAILAIKEYNQILCSSPANKNSACLNYSLNLCIGMCLGGSAVEKHNSIIKNVIALLKGNDTKLIDEMEQKMAAAAEQFAFEAAVKVRDQLEDITYLLKKEKVIDFTEEDKNIVMIECLSDKTFKLFLIKRNKLLYNEKFSRENTTMVQLSSIIHSVFSKTDAPLSIELTKDELDEAQIIYSYLENSAAISIVIPDQWLVQNQTSYIEDAMSSLLSVEN